MKNLYPEIWLVLNERGGIDFSINGSEDEAKMAAQKNSQMGVGGSYKWRVVRYVPTPKRSGA